MKIRLISLMILCILVVQSSILLLFMFNNYNRYSNELNDQADSQLHNIQSRLSHSLPLLLWNYNEVAVLENLNSELKNTTLLSIIIKYEGAIEYQVSNEPRIQALELSAQSLLEHPNVSQPIALTFENRDGPSIVGQLYIIDDREELNLKIKNEFKIKLIQIIIIDLSLILLISILIYQFVLRPINKTILGLKNIVQSENTLSKELPGHYIFEINDLSEYYNQLRNYVKKMLDDLQLKTDNIEAVFNNTKNALLLINNKGVVQSANHAVGKLFKKDENSAINHEISDIIKNPLIQNFMHQQHNTSTKNLTFELDLTKKGINFYISITISKVKQGDNHAYILVIQDITKQHTLYHDLETALEKEQENTKLKSEFLASMSHEIRTPMNGVIGMLDLIAKTELDTQQLHYNKIAKSSANSLLVIINDILDFSKIEAGKLEIENIEFDLLKLMGEVSQSMAVKAQEKGLEMWLDTSNFSESAVIGDPSRIRQILTNLINNATKFTSSGDILITINPPIIDNNIISFSCTIKDSGIGIAPEKLNQLFESFSQVDSSTTRQFGGTGLGLSIVKKLCLLMNGDVYVNSEIGKGSEFTFTLSLEKTNHPSQTHATDISKQKISVIEQNKLGEFVLTKLLSSMNNHPYFIELDQYTVENINKMSPEFVLIDTTTTQDQTEIVVKNILTLCPTIKIILISNINKLSNLSNFKKLGVHAEIGKPIIYNELLISLTGKQQTKENEKIPLDPEPAIKDAPIKTELAKPNNNLENNLVVKTKVLLVEDNWVNQEIAIALLESFDMEVDVANHGKEALALLQKQQKESSYKLIFMDCLMPEMDGYETTSAIRRGQGDSEQDKNIISSTLPIIAMTANAMKGDREKCITSGMDDYLSKPINEDELLNKIKKWMH